MMIYFVRMFYLLMLVWFSSILKFSDRSLLIGIALSLEGICPVSSNQLKL